MVSRSHIIAAVIFILVLGAGAVGFYFWLEPGQGQTRPLVIRTQQNVGGVSGGTAVKFKGLKVGHVTDVGFAPDDASTVRIRLEIRDSVPLNKSSYAELSGQGITGVGDLAVHTPKSRAAALHGSDDKPLQLPLHPGLMDRLKRRGESILDKVSTIADQIKALTGDGNSRHIKQSLQQLEEATRQLNEIEHSMQPAVKDMPRLTAQLESNLKQTQKLMEQAVPAVQQLQKTAETADDIGQSGSGVMRQLDSHTLPNIDILSQQLQKTARQVQKLSSELSEKPQSPLTGPPKPDPGPGEPGFEP